MKRISRLLAAVTGLCLLLAPAGPMAAESPEKQVVLTESGGWPPEIIGAWVGLYEGLWSQFTFYPNGKFGLTVFESPDLDRSGTRETFPNMEEIAFEGDLWHFPPDGAAGAFRRIDNPYFRVKARDQKAAPSVNHRLVGTYGGRIKGTYVEWTFGADGGFSQFTSAEASVQEGYYIANGLELAIKTSGKIIHSAYLYLIRQDTVTVDLPGEGKVTLSRKPGQLKQMSVDYDGDIVCMWQPKELIVWRYLGNETEVGMSLGGYTPVAGIGDEAFMGNKAVQSVTVPYSIIRIGSAAFQGCESLQNVLLIGTETDLGGWTFGDSADVLKQDGIYAVPGSAPLKTIGEGAFRGCVRLENLNIAKSAREAPLNHYIGWSDIEGINIPDGVTSIGAYAFEGCESITGVTIPDSVTEIGMNAFKGCSQVTLIVSKDSYPMRYARNYGIPYTFRNK